MKKVLIGCLALVLVLGIGGAIGAYYFVWRPAKAAYAEFSKLKAVPKLNEQVQKKVAFTPPPSGELTQADVDRFLRVQTTVNTRLGSRADELAKKYRLMENIPNEKRSVTELISAYRDLAQILLDGKRFQVDALNENNFSLDEYKWTRTQVYAAANIPVEIDLEKLFTAIAEGDTKAIEKGVKPTRDQAIPVPENNRALVTPHQKLLTDRAGLVMLGL